MYYNDHAPPIFSRMVEGSLGTRALRLVEVLRTEALRSLARGTGQSMGGLSRMK
jgi:hypothetical protein